MAQTYVRCSKCTEESHDQDDVALVKDWKKNRNYSPCPNPGCDGQMEVHGDSLVSIVNDVHDQYGDIPTAVMSDISYNRWIN